MWSLLRRLTGGLMPGVDVLTHTPLDRPLGDSTVQRMVDAGAISLPTLVMMHAVAQARLGDQADAAFENSMESVRRMHAAGVVLIAGTDAHEPPMAPVPHGSSLHDEIALLQQAGMTGAEAFHAATSRAAAAFSLADRGSLTAGCRADLVLLDADPVATPSAARQPAAVWIGGVLSYQPQAADR